MSLCPCDSKLEYSQCCQPFHLGEAIPQTPEQLMRSRYCAYTLEGLGEYLLATWHPNTRPKNSAKELDKVAQNWRQLEILKADKKQPKVEFVAWYENADSSRWLGLHEVSQFKQEEGRWFYVDGAHKPTRYKKPNETNPAKEKIGRNDPCFCGSGQKYKKCCAA